MAAGAADRRAVSPRPTLLLLLAALLALAAAAAAHRFGSTRNQFDASIEQRVQQSRGEFDAGLLSQKTTELAHVGDETAW